MKGKTIKIMKTWEINYISKWQSLNKRKRSKDKKT